MTYITPDDVRNYLQDTSLTDEYLNPLIEFSENWLWNVIGANYTPVTDKEEYFDISPNDPYSRSNYIYTYHVPLTNLKHVYFYDETLGDYVEQDLSDFIVYNNVGKIVYKKGYFPRGWKSVKIIYDGGESNNPLVKNVLIKKVALEVMKSQLNNKSGTVSYKIGAITIQKGFNYNFYLQTLTSLDTDILHLTRKVGELA